MAETIVVAGALAQRPRRGGHAWVFLQYLLGFRRLGWDVLFVDRLEPGMLADDATGLSAFVDLMARFGLADAYAVLLDGGERSIGLPRREVLARARRAPLLLNVMGYLADEEILALAGRRVFLDIDPGFGQMWRELDLGDVMAGHDDFVTVGANVGEPGCAVPTGGRAWIRTRPPVVLEAWPVQPAAGRAFTSVASWRGAFGPVEYDGRTYGLRVHEFRKFAALPRMVSQPFELALDIHPADARDRTLLEESGWRLVDPLAAAGDPQAYQRYVQRSAAEFMVAKGMYVQARTGWFSDRSACYLASGRPVVVQDTGLAGHYPTGAGLLAFTTPEEAAAAVEAVAGDYRHHARAARRLAEEWLDSDAVLAGLLRALNVA